MKKDLGAVFNTLGSVRVPPTPDPLMSNSITTGNTRQRNGAASTTTTAQDIADKRNEGLASVLDRAPPPWHAVVTIIILSVGSLLCLPSLAKLDEIATVETFTARLFPELLSLHHLALLRGGVAMVIWITTLYNLLFPGWKLMPPYLPSSKLKMVPIQMSGMRTLYPFTSWSWIILGVSFTLSSYIAWIAEAAIAVDKQLVMNRWLLRLAMVSWEIAAPFAVLTATVVRYALWPAVLKRGGPHSLNSPRNMLMHNANVLVALTEAFLWSGLPVRWSEAAVAPLCGCLYVVFSWNIVFIWSEKRHGPQFIYFFLDTTLPGYTCTKVLVALWVILLSFYCIFCTAHDVLGYWNGEITVHTIAVALWCSLVMRVRD